MVAASQLIPCLWFRCCLWPATWPACWWAGSTTPRHVFKWVVFCMFKFHQYCGNIPAYCVIVGYIQCTC